MRALKTYFILLIIACCTVQTRAQYSGDYDYTIEKVWGVTKATNSGLIGGFSFKYLTQLKKDDHYHGGMLELVNIKHPQEQRVYSDVGNSFIFGKEHYLYSIRFTYLRQVVFFKKAAQQGVQVSGILGLGATLGLEAPYYVELKNGEKVPYDPNTTSINDIVGTGHILQGVFESDIVPGINGKAAIAFEFGAFKSSVVGLEVGFQSDFFTRQIIIIPTTVNYSVFPSAYFTLFYGSRR